METRFRCWAWYWEHKDGRTDGRSADCREETVG